MNRKNANIRILLPAIGLLLIAGSFVSAPAQEQRWIVVGETQSFFMDYGTECELVANRNYLSWPTQYGDNQLTTRMKGLWIGAKNFYDPVEKKTKGVKVIGAGPRLPANQFTMIFPKGIKLIGRNYPTMVVVDQKIGTNNTLYDVLDDVDENLPCDRMVVMQFNTSIGVSVTKKVMGFMQQNHDNYFIHDYVFKNTGIYNEAGDVHKQALQDFWVYFNYRYGFAGVTSSGFGSAWGAFASEWGTSTVFVEFGQDPSAAIRGFFGYYGPCKDRQAVTYEQDWGCPNHLEDGLLGSAKYAGAVTLLASKSAKDWTNDNSQPRTTSYINADGTTLTAAVSQFDETYMAERYKWMTEGHLPQTMEQSVGDKYVADWRSAYPDRDSGGGPSQGQGYGPYTLAYGDSIHIVFAEGVNGLGWEKCREIGANWFSYFKGTSKPALKMPDGSTETSYTKYTRAWVETGRDSIMQTFRNAQANFKAGYKILQPPSPPNNFTVTSGGDKIRLTWANNAATAPHFNGYVIYRSEGNVKVYKTKYTKIFECNASNAVHQFDDVTAVRGFNYYYYIQSKDDGTQNDVEPGKPLYSSLFMTLTSVDAHLLRPAGKSLDGIRVVPNPYDIRSRVWQFGDKSQYDRLAFYGLPPACKIKIYTERGDLIWEKDHNNGAGDELWDSMTSSRQIVVSGVYIAYFEVTEDAYDTDGTTLLFRNGESTYRKFVIIR
jgi:hypothetical protein